MDNQIFTKSTPINMTNKSDEKVVGGKSLSRCVSRFLLFPRSLTLKSHWKSHIRKDHGDEGSDVAACFSMESALKFCSNFPFTAYNFVFQKSPTSDYHHLSFRYHRRKILCLFVVGGEQIERDSILYSRKTKGTEKLTNNRNIENFSTMTAWNIK